MLSKYWPAFFVALAIASWAFFWVASTVALVFDEANLENLEGERRWRKAGRATDCLKAEVGSTGRILVVVK